MLFRGTYEVCSRCKYGAIQKVTSGEEGGENILKLSESKENIILMVMTGHNPLDFNPIDRSAEDIYRIEYQ